MAARSKYTPKAVEDICTAIRLGATYKLAAAYAGVEFETFRQWRLTKPAFSAALKDAEGQAAVTWLARIEQAAKDGTWQAAAWKLERRYPEDYGRTIQDVRHKHEARKEAEAIAAEIGKPDLIDQIERDILVSIEARP